MREGGSEGGREGGREGRLGLGLYFQNDCQTLDSTESMTHGDRSMTNAQALLQSAWLGDAVSVKRCLVSNHCTILLVLVPCALAALCHALQSGAHYLDVNCTNRNGLTPLLLVTKDVSLFTEGIGS